MNILKQFVSGLGQQNAPFGFAPDNPNASYQAGLSYIGDIGANLMANNQPGVNPWANLGASLQQAKATSVDRNRQQYTAQQLMEEAAARKAEKEQADAERQKRDAFIKTLPPDVQMKAISIPGFLEDYVKATDPTFQKPEKPTFMEVNGKIVNPATREVIYDGGSASNSITSQIAERQAAAEALGLTPDDPAYKSYIFTGKMPREDQAPLTAGDKQAIREADDAILANTTAIEQLQSVLSGKQGETLNDRAGYGAFADWQSWAARNDPTGVFDDNKGQATTDLKNVVLGQALASLKTIFGSAPTEGERQILIELQASVDKTPDERKSIIERAIKLAEKRLQFNKDRASELRGQTYYKPGGGAKTVVDGVTIEEVP